MSSEVAQALFSHIPDGWDCARLVDCTTDGNISYGIVQPGRYTDDGIPIIRVNNVNNGQLELNGVLKVAPEIEEKYKRTRIIGGEVLLTLVGSTGQSFVAPSQLAGWNVPRAIAVIRPKVEIGADWINICLQSKPVQHFLDVRANTTVQKTLNLKDVRDIPIPLPPEGIKEKIESIAVSLQGKIELNRQINQTLEHIAQAIFKSWFVDFDPIKAKIQAKQNGQDPERAAMCAISGKTDTELDAFLEASTPEQRQQLTATAALFPDELEDSDLGQFPKGWSPGVLGDICYLNANSWTKKNSPDEVWYVDLANTKNGVIEEVQHYLWNEAPSRARRVAKPGDTIVGTVRPGNRSFALVGDTGSQLTASTGFAVLTPKNNDYREYVYIAATSEANIARLAHLADGAAYPAVRPDIVTQAECLIPAEPIVQRFRELVGPLFQLREANLMQYEVLSACRDSLLPKLLSGEIALDGDYTNEGKVA